MAMDTIIATLACCLLAPSFAVAQTEKGHLSSTPTPTITTPGLNLTHIMTTVISSNNTVHATVTSNSTEDITLTSTSPDNETFTTTTTATTENTNHPETSPSTTILIPLTNSTSLTTTAPGTQMTIFTMLTTPAIQTTVGYISTPDTALTAHSSPMVNTTSDSSYRTTQGLGLKISEKYMTIVFSVVLGVFAFALVIFMFHKCKHKTQYFHQPLNDTDNTGAFVDDDDTLVISGGLYDGHPIYDNVPPAPADQSQFRLEFLH